MNTFCIPILILLQFFFSSSCSQYKVKKISEAVQYANERTNHDPNKQDYTKYYLSNIDIEDEWWKKSGEAKETAKKILKNQLESGGWSKGSQYVEDLSFSKELVSSFDNFTTTSEIRFLLKYYFHHRDKKYIKSILKGLNYIFKAQYPTGAWPQCYPLQSNYCDYATFNDSVIQEIIDVLIMISQDKKYNFVGDSIILSAKNSLVNVEKFIIKSQIQRNEKKLGWSQQYDPFTYKPKSARAFEPVAIAARETVELIKILEKINNPSAEILASINSAKAWLKESAIEGYSWDQKTGILIKQSENTIWARFYDINTNKAIFCDYDGIIKNDVSKLSDERKTGYQWYGDWAKSLI